MQATGPGHQGNCVCPPKPPHGLNAWAASGPCERLAIRAPCTLRPSALPRSLPCSWFRGTFPVTLG